MRVVLEGIQNEHNRHGAFPPPWIGSRSVVKRRRDHAQVVVRPHDVATVVALSGDRIQVFLSVARVHDSSPSFAAKSCRYLLFHSCLNVGCQLVPRNAAKEHHQLKHRLAFAANCKTQIPRRNSPQQWWTKEHEGQSAASAPARGQASSSLRSLEAHVPSAQKSER